MKRIFSGIQPSGVIHLGNYLGAIKQWVKLQESADEAIFCIVDLHAITVWQKPEELRQNILSTAAIYLASGIDPKKSVIFLQSDRCEHSELAWILNCQVKIAELFRMTQFKEKSGKENRENIGAGLFNYPVLMAADILLYHTTDVPVGEDQKQHVELARNIAQRFNKLYGNTFVVPKPLINSQSARIMGLDNPNKKMSKSAESKNNYISLIDSAEVVKQKIQKAVTDSGSEIKAKKDKPAITNLLNIYSDLSGTEVSKIEEEFEGKSYAAFKEKLAELIIEKLKPIQSRYHKYLADKSELIKILKDGSNKIAPVAEKTIAEVKKKVGLGL